MKQPSRGESAILARASSAGAVRAVRVYQVHDLGFLAGGTYLVGDAMNANGWA